MLSALLMMVILMIIFPSRLLHILYCAAATVVFGFILIADTQMIKGGKANSIGEDDYILAALMIYVDIITIFLQLFQLLSELTRE